MATETRIKNLKEQVYEILKSNILTGVYKPGERLHELEIAGELNVSRSPVREALKQLIGEGLLESIPHKSITVKKFSEKEIIDIFEFRSITEKYSIEKTIENLNDEIRETLERFKNELIEKNKAGDLIDYIQTDSELHQYIIKSSGNTVLYNAVINILTLMGPFREISLGSTKRFSESLDEHLGIIDGILDRDFKKAWGWCESHLQKASEEVLIYLSSKSS